MSIAAMAEMQRQSAQIDALGQRILVLQRRLDDQSIRLEQLISQLAEPKRGPGRPKKEQE